MKFIVSKFKGNDPVNLNNLSGIKSSTMFPSIEFLDIRKYKIIWSYPNQESRDEEYDKIIKLFGIKL